MELITGKETIAITGNTIINFFILLGILLGYYRCLKFLNEKYPINKTNKRWET